MNRIIFFFKTYLFRLFSIFFRFIPLQNIVIFDHFGGKGFGDDPKYIALNLLSRLKDYRLMWLVHDCKNTGLPQGIEPLKIASLKACFYLSIAKVWVASAKGGTFHYVTKRKGQLYIQTWHCTFGLKKLGIDNDKSDFSVRKRAIRDSAITDIMYANSDYRVKKYQEIFWSFKGRVLKCDVPRVAFLMKNDNIVKKKVYDYFSIPLDSKIVMYAPTFRKNNTIDTYLFDYHRIVSSLEKVSNKKYVFLLRLHPKLSNNPIVNNLPYDDKVIKASGYPDMAELLNVTDLLITDFSSSMFDAAIAKKAVMLFAKDYEQYLQKDRDLYFYPKDLPFPFSENENDLLRCIENFDRRMYEKDCDAFFKTVGLQDNGNGDQIIGDLILKHLSIG